MYCSGLRRYGTCTSIFILLYVIVCIMKIKKIIKKTFGEREA